MRREIRKMLVAGCTTLFCGAACAREFHLPKFKMNLPECSWNISEGLAVCLVIGGLIAFVCYYAKALTLVKMGRLIVYRDWGDFLKSSLWFVAIPLGLSWLCDGGQDLLMRAVGLVLIVLGVYCFGWMIAGAFKYNSGSKCWLALFARFAVTLLILFALAKLNEKLEQYRRHQLGVIRGVLIPLLIFGFVFNQFIRPMIGTRYYQAWRQMRN